MKSVPWIAHRACWAGAVENATYGIMAAGNGGAPAIEVDIQQARDGSLWLLHDPRVDRTTTGTGQLGQLDESAIRALRLRNAAGHESPQGVPTLQEALRVSAAYPRMMVYLERKTGSARDVIRAIEAEGYRRELMLTSVSRSWLREVHALRPAWRLGIVLTGPPQAATLAEAQTIGARALCVPAAGLRKEHVVQAQEVGLQMLVWFRQEPDDERLQQVLALEVDGVFVKNPDQRQ